MLSTGADTYITPIYAIYRWGGHIRVIIVAIYMGGGVSPTCAHHLAAPVTAKLLNVACPDFLTAPLEYLNAHCNR